MGAYNHQSTFSELIFHTVLFSTEKVSYSWSYWALIPSGTQPIHPWLCTAVWAGLPSLTASCDLVTYARRRSRLEQVVTLLFGTWTHLVVCSRDTMGRFACWERWQLPPQFQVSEMTCFSVWVMFGAKRANIQNVAKNRNVSRPNFLLGMKACSWDMIKTHNWLCTMLWGPGTGTGSLCVCGVACSLPWITTVNIYSLQLYSVHYI